MIPMCDVAQQYESLRGEIDAAMQQVAKDGHYILGPNVAAFEKEAAAFCQVERAVGVGNGTDALHLALRALGIGPGDEVITTPFTFIATAEAVSLLGATPVFVDIDPQTFNIDPAKIEPAITPRTKALLPVHLFGQPCDMNPVLDIARRHGLFVVEDCAQAMGATYKGKPVGGLGDAGCFSFFPSKNLGCLGDGGMVVSNNPEIAERVEVLRRHGGRVKYYHDEVGVNSRLDELQAAILRVKLPHLATWNRQRREHAAWYNAQLHGLPGLRCPLERQHDGDRIGAVYNQYTVLVDDRDAVTGALKSQGVGSAIYYPVPLHRQTVYADLGYADGSLPQAEEAARHCLSLPIFPEMTAEQRARVVDSLTAAVSASRPQATEKGLRRAG